MLVRDDIARSGKLRDERYAVQVVKHVHVPKEETKFLGAVQTKYEKKNWSSVMLVNCATLHRAHPRLREPRHRARAAPVQVAGRRRRSSARFPARWNHLVGYDAPAARTRASCTSRSAGRGSASTSSANTPTNGAASVTACSPPRGERRPRPPRSGPPRRHGARRGSPVRLPLVVVAGLVHAPRDHVALCGQRERPRVDAAASPRAARHLRLRLQPHLPRGRAGGLFGRLLRGVRRRGPVALDHVLRGHDARHGLDRRQWRADQEGGISPSPAGVRLGARLLRGARGWLRDGARRAASSTASRSTFRACRSP